MFLSNQKSKICAAAEPKLSSKMLPHAVGKFPMRQTAHFPACLQRKPLKTSH
jgi:hypothetical protein